jgi:hypothetical protein
MNRSSIIGCYRRRQHLDHAIFHRKETNQNRADLFLADCSALFRSLHIKEDAIFQALGGQHRQIEPGLKYTFPKALAAIGFRVMCGLFVYKVQNNRQK